MKQNINLTISFPTNTPNLNGAIYTYDAVKKAFYESQAKRLPIIDRTKDKERVVGVATPVSYSLSPDHCLISNDCFLFNSDIIEEFDMECIVNKFHKNKDRITIIDDFRINGFSISL